ncbi:MAG TPA: hypothetical protein VMV83_16855 [Rectinemataceae bacterium]|nr:hypothetical protein [Rectinemataceae bacterium]
MVRQAASAGEELSPLQRKFNNLVRRIETLRASIVEETARGDEVLAYRAKEYAPVLPEIANTQIRLAFAIDEKAGGFKLGVRQKEAVGEAIVGLLGEAFNTVEAHEEGQALFSRWSETSFDEELEAQKQEAVDGLREAFFEGFGIEIDEETLAKGPEAISEALLEQAEEQAKKASVPSIFPL